MRVLANSEDKLLADFDNWSVTLGDGALPLIGDPSEEQIRLPAERCFEVDDSQLQRDMKQFCDIVYPNLGGGIHNLGGGIHSTTGNIGSDQQNQGHNQHPPDEQITNRGGCPAERRQHCTDWRRQPLPH